jgi:hypothetical protein
VFSIPTGTDGAISAPFWVDCIQISLLLVVSGGLMKNAPGRCHSDTERSEVEESRPENKALTRFLAAFGASE